MHARLLQPAAEPGSLTLYRAEPDSHREFADQLHGETFRPVKGRGRTVNEWSARPGRPANHFFDCLVLAAVAANMTGAALPGANMAPRKRRRSETHGQKNKEAGERSRRRRAARY